nr:hypothetical protein [Tanacetum cinerariifolium]
MPHNKEFASPKQMTLGKDELNPLIVDSLLKTIWSSMHHVIAKHWLFQRKRLLCLSAKTTSSNEFSSTMAFVIICLATNQKFNFSSLKFQELMDLCTRLSNKVLDLESEVIDIKSSFTDKIEKLKGRVHKLEEKNMILKEKSFKYVKIDTAAPVEDKEESFQQGRMIAYMDEDVEVNLEEAQAKAYNLDLQHSEKVFSMQDIKEEKPAEVEEVLEVVTDAKLITEVVTTSEPTTTAAQVPKVSDPRRRRDVVIQDPEETATSVIMPIKLEAELNENINRNDVLEQVKRSERQNNAVMRYQVLKRKPLTEAQARKNMMIYLKNMAGFKMKFFKGNKRQGESIEQEIAKKQTMDEEAEELKRHMLIMANDDDESRWKSQGVEEPYKKDSMIVDMDEDVEVNLEEAQAKEYNLDLQHSEKVLSMQDIDEEEHDEVEEVLKVVTTAKLITKVVSTAEPTTTTAQVPKVSAPRRRGGMVIQDPEVTAASFIVHIESRWKSQVVLKLHYLLKNFNREDLKTLWNLVKERFETTEPKNFSDEFLLNVLKIMLEKPNIEANVWKDQKGRYGLKVEEDSEMSLELLRIVTHGIYGKRTWGGRDVIWKGSGGLQVYGSSCGRRVNITRLLAGNLVGALF